MLNKQHKIKDAHYHSNFETPVLIGRWDDENKIFIMKTTKKKRFKDLGIYNLNTRYIEIKNW